MLVWIYYIHQKVYSNGIYYKLRELEYIFQNYLKIHISFIGLSET